MDDMIFERNYQNTPEPTVPKPQDPAYYEKLRSALPDDFLSSREVYANAPKVVIPQDKQNYEELLQLCDAWAQQNHAALKGIVDFHAWEARIDVTAPHFEFCSGEDFSLLRKISEKADSVTVTPFEDGKMRLRISIDYFDDVVTDEQKKKMAEDTLRFLENLTKQ